MKVAVDAGAGRVDTVPAVTTVSAMRALRPPSRPLPFNARIAPYELKIFRVRAVLRQVISESDGDWHLVLEDPDHPGATMVGEIPDSSCALGSMFAGRYAAVRRDLRAAPRNALVEVEGVGFFDYIHGQRGVAPNGIELHPILSARIVGRPSRTAESAAPDSVATGANKVWVNSASSVYHCPGTRWYGATKAGYYASEQQARASGARPAYGRKCS